MSNQQLPPTRYLIAMVFLLAVISITGGGYLAYKQSEIKEDSHEDEFHIHAAFKLYKDGEFQDLSGIQYMHLGDCGDDFHEDGEADPPHLHDFVGDVVHVHAEGQTWRQLLGGLEVEVDEADTAFLNNADAYSTKELLDMEIAPYDRVLFLQGQTEEDLQKLKDEVPSVERIKEVEKEGESCTG